MIRYNQIADTKHELNGNDCVIVSECTTGSIVISHFQVLTKCSQQGSVGRHAPGSTCRTSHGLICAVYSPAAETHVRWGRARNPFELAVCRDPPELDTELMGCRWIRGFIEHTVFLYNCNYYCS